METAQINDAIDLVVPVCLLSVFDMLDYGVLNLLVDVKLQPDALNSYIFQYYVLRVKLQVN